MRIRKKSLAVMAFLLLPLSALSAIGGIQASANPVPTLACPSIQSDPTPSVPGTAGMTFDSGGGPGSAGMYLDSNAGTVGGTALLANASNGDTQLEIGSYAIPGQYLSVNGASGEYTVLNSSFIGRGTPYTVTITPALIGIVPVHGHPGVIVATHNNHDVTIYATTNGSWRVVGDGIVNGTDLQSATANFTGADLGQPVTTFTGGSSDFATGSSVTILMVNDTTDVTLSMPVINAASGVAVTIGNTSVGYSPLTRHIDVQGVTCLTQTTLPPGEFVPSAADIIGTSPGSNAAISIEETPPTLSSTVTFPNIEGVSPPPDPTTMTFNASHNTFNIVVDAFDYGRGVVTGDFPQSGSTGASASLNLEVTGAVVCTEGQIQAIELGTGPDSTTIPLGASELSVCDGGTSSSRSLLATLTSLIEQQLGASYTTTDGTPYAAVWQFQVDGNAVI